MGTVKVLSANDIKRIAGISGRQYKRVQWHSAEIVVRPFLSIEEYIEVVKRIVEDCKSPDGEVMPELVDFATRTNVIGAYAFVELPEDAADLYYDIYASDLFDTILCYINKSQFAAIEKAVSIALYKEASK